MRNIFIKSLSILSVFGFLALAFSPVQAAEYVIDHDKSLVSFTGTHADVPFKGTFQTWSGSIDFDPQQLEKSSITAKFDMQSVKTGNPMYDGTLPQKDWFNSKEFPEAVFKSTAITHKENDVYHVTGALTLRDHTISTSFDFTLSDINQDHVTAHASFPIDRLAFGIGKKSDDKAEWVSREITVILDITAKNTQTP